MAKISLRVTDFCVTVGLSELFALEMNVAEYLHDQLFEHLCYSLMYVIVKMRVLFEQSLPKMSRIGNINFEKRLKRKDRIFISELSS